MFLKKLKCPGKGAPRFAAALLGAALALSAFNVSVVWAAVAAPVVTDSSGAALADKGRTVVTGGADVFITPVTGATYYYAFADVTVDAYYAGETGSPVGSYFDGSQVSGDLVKTLMCGTPVGAAEGYKITVPAPADKQAVSLYVAAYIGSDSSTIYTHTFIDANAPIVVTDGANTVFANGGATATDAATDAYIINAQAGTDYYYTFAGGFPVDVYYAGADNNPVGSYFDGPLTNGAFVAAINASSDLGTKIVANANGDMIIPVPAPSIWGTPSYTLSITAVPQGGIAQVVFTHTFRYLYDVTADFAAGTASFTNYSDKAFAGSLILAVYDSAGRLVYAEYKPLGAQVSFGANTSAYPAGAYSMKVFCWDADFAPLCPVISD